MESRVGVSWGLGWTLGLGLGLGLEARRVGIGIWVRHVPKDHMHAWVLVRFLNALCNGCENFSQVAVLSSVGGAMEYLELSLFHSKNCSQKSRRVC